MIRLWQDIDDMFDYYILADSLYGPYTLYLSGSVRMGISALYRNVPGYGAPYEITVSPAVILPATLGGQEIVFYTAVVEAGRVPPVSSLSEVSADTPYIIMFDKKTRTVAP